MDFVSDSLVNGRRLKLLTVADDFTRACVDIAADYGISGQYVTRPARPGGTVRRLPQCGAHRQRTGVHQPRLHGLGAGQGVRHLLIEPGKPMQNGFIESFRASCATSA